MLSQRKHSALGFTLIELVIVIVILGIVVVGLSGFIRNGMSIYTDVVERDQILNDSRFFVERLNRELRQAVPNSARTESFGNTQCLEFVPALWTSFYTSLSVSSNNGLDSSAQGTIVEVADNPFGYQLTSRASGVAGDFAFVYPLTSTHIYEVESTASEPRRREILSCTEATSGDGDCNTDDEPNNTATLGLSGAFFQDSPASRMYFARNSTTYCALDNGQVWRYQTEIAATQLLPSSGGVLMVEGLTNTAPFRVDNPTFDRNGIINVLLSFDRNDETVDYNLEIGVPNVP